MRILAVIHEQRSEDARSDARRPVDLNASLRMAGMKGIGCVVSNISIAGFMAKSYAPVQPGSLIWLRVPGFAALSARVVWCDDGRIGCQFETPITPETLVRIVAEAPNLH
ncbi:PilZ domain-containing protein [Sphingomonas laterariae]|uniref:PilZ domain-containing protein n=1 Tax=Edaphosphingomonas laterariae TaxID=861865 RepID=A0A239GNC9_9SPHN|nr:PilZ domain-containing protein [Sphingomonas laterariae]SNS70268.1 PilZ domain-containing protein [Sphingomonas laterariae]